MMGGGRGWGGRGWGSGGGWWIPTIGLREKWKKKIHSRAHKEKYGAN